MAGAGDKDTIRFVLDGETVELRDVDPTRTVLQYLREDLGRTGTKEGCAEGDCGACTVVLAEAGASDDGVRLRAVNSCIQFLPTLDGKQLITVESLTSPDGNPHPVQQAMVDSHGSQCGFCTPGFVMSLYALYETQTAPTRVEIDDTLAGNLCRCTGYRPIVAAARAMYGLSKPQRSPIDLAALRRVANDNSLSLVCGGRRYYAPRSASALADLLATHDDATLLAGGTDVGLWVTKQHRELATVVYTGQVAELNRLEVSATHIEIGAAVTLSDATPVIVEHYPNLDELMRRFASPPIRNAGTLGGNVANGSPIGDSMPALMAAGTSLILRSVEGTRELPLDTFYLDYGVNALAPGEFIETIRVPLPGDHTMLHSHKLSKRFDQDISAVCTAYRLELDGEEVRSFRMACGGLAATVRRADRCELAVNGSRWNDATIRAAMKALAEDFEPITDMRASAGYRLRGAQNLLYRFYLETTGRFDTTLYGYGRQA